MFRDVAVGSHEELEAVALPDTNEQVSFIKLTSREPDGQDTTNLAFRSEDD